MSSYVPIPKRKRTRRDGYTRPTGRRPRKKR